MIEAEFFPDILISKPNLLIFACGNPSRGDDALGPLLLERLEAEHFADARCLTDFQLQVEHALDLADCDLALFVDAHVCCRPPFEFSQVRPASDRSYTTHAMSPAAVLQVHLEIHQRPPPPSFLLSIRGEGFELGEPLSPSARTNLEAAFAFAKTLCEHPDPAHWLGLIEPSNHR